MAGATEQQRKQMEAAEAQVRQALAAANAKVREIQNSWLPTSNTEQQLIGAVKMNTATYYQWAGEWKAWALAGRNAETGDDYPVSFWLRTGSDLSRGLTSVTGAFHDTDAFTLVEETVEATAATVAKGAASTVAGALELTGAALKGAVPNLVPELNWKGKLALAVVGLGVAGLGTAYVARAFK
jgi:hypothetical protein